MNQPTKSKPTPPAATATDASGSDWNLDVPRKRGASETRIGLLLVVCLVGALGYMTCRKLEERRRHPGDSAFQKQSSAANPETDPGDSPAGDQNHAGELNGPAQNEPVDVLNAGWSGGQPEPANVTDNSDNRTPWTGTEQYQSSPPLQREPDEAPPRTFAQDAPSELAYVRNAAAPESEPDSQQFAGDATWNFDSANTASSAPRTDEFAPADDSGTTGTSLYQESENTSTATSGWADSPTDQPVDLPDPGQFDIESSPAQPPFGTSNESPVSDFTSEPTSDLFGSDPRPVEVSGADENIVVESSDGPVLEPLLVPADDARVMPVGSDGTTGDFSQHAAVETASGNPWDSTPPRELAQNTGPAEVEFDLGGTSAAAPTNTTETASPDPGFLPDSGNSAEPVEQWNSDPFGGSRATSAGYDDPAGGSRTTGAASDPFAQSLAGTNLNASDDVPVHTVRSGENFWSIAHTYYQAGRYANALAAFNQARIPDPRKMKPGMKVLVPDKQVLVQRYPRLTGAAYGPASTVETARTGFFVDRSGQPAYRVGKNDTLTGIAARHLGRSSRWVQVLGMNRDQLKDANSLKIGMVLKLPLDATRVGVVPGSTIAR